MEKRVYSSSRNLEWEDGNVWLVYWFKFSTFDELFDRLKMFVFGEHLVKLCVFCGNLVNYLENLQILPLGNVRLFRRIRKNDAPFLKTCVFFAEISIFRPNR